MTLAAFVERRFGRLADGHLWARLQLAELHRGLGRDTDAREIEADLRARLALADLHHAIRRELARRE